MSEKQPKTCDCWGDGSEHEVSLCCGYGTCETDGVSKDFASCIHCGADMIQVDGAWYHHSQFENGVLTSPDYIHDFTL